MVATIAIDQQQRLRKRQLQGFGVGVGLGTAAPAPFIPEPEDLLTYSPTPQPSNAATLQSSAPPTSIEPTAMPSIRYPPSPPPTNLSTGGAVAVIGGMDETVDLPYQLNFHVEFQMLTEDFGAATDEMKDFLSAYLTTMELSMDAEHTEGPLQVVGLDVTTQGTCPTTSSKLVCEKMRVAISCKVNQVSEYSDLVISGRIRSEFVEKFNYESNQSQLLFEYPIFVIGALLFSVDGPTEEMDDNEKAYFAAFAERRVIEPIFEQRTPEEYLLRRVDSSNDFPVAGRSDYNIDARQSADAKHKLVELFVLAMCRSETACTHANFQHHIERSAVPSVDSLMSALRAVGDEVPYFSQIKSLQILPRSDGLGVPNSNEIGQNNPSVAVQNTGSTAPKVQSKQQIPLWVWMLVVADFAVMVGIFAYVSHRRSKRKTQGDKMKDSSEEKQNRRMSLQVAPFHQRPKPEEPVIKTAEQIEEEEYDARSYDFSVEAGDLSDDDSEVDLSSFRRPRTKPF